ncbi:zinc finger protein 184-like [Artemia franciscana]|uniref:C2H2-type domain-containing protein n=1 Tax=Artemia franciscana TaxID=6661 RepID=A0AA88KVH4_ARTSF|nr:hypothetical protein QYM36_014281 [Artemia franciscana]
MMEPISHSNTSATNEELEDRLPSDTEESFGSEKSVLSPKEKDIPTLDSPTTSTQPELECDSFQLDLASNHETGMKMDPLLGNADLLLEFEMSLITDYANTTVKEDLDPLCKSMEDMTSNEEGVLQAVTTKKHECIICKKMFSHNSRLIEHIRTHTGEKPYVCEVCEWSFTNRQNLARHMEIHTGDKAFKCRLCKMSFTQKRLLTTHSVIHNVEKSYKCPLCKKSFVRKSYLNAHMKTHTGERAYVCQVCKKGFRRRQTLTDHSITHTEEKPHECEFCKKSFARRTYLARHMKTHMRKNIQVQINESTN